MTGSVELHAFDRSTASAYNSLESKRPMGQVHPSGPNVVKLTQRGGGHNCECGRPDFDEHEIASDARLTQLVPPQEIVQMVQTANSVMKKVYKNILPAMVVMMIIGSMIPQLLLVYINPDDDNAQYCRTKQVCGAVNASFSYDAEGATLSCRNGCDVKCCQWNEEAEEKKCSAEFDTRHEFTKKIQNGEPVHDEECCLPEKWPKRCEDTYIELSGNIKRRPPSTIVTVLLPIIFLVSFGVPVGLLWKNQIDVKKAILDTFQPWSAKGIRLEYRRPQKHFVGALYFHLPYIQEQYQPQLVQAQPFYPQQQMINSQPGQQYAQIHPHLGQPVQVIQMVQQQPLSSAYAGSLVDARQGVQPPHEKH